MNKKLLCAAVAAIMISTPVMGAFPDVPENAYYMEAVIQTEKKGFFKGDDKGNFNPENTITRAEFTTLMCRIMGLEKLAGEYATESFSDLDRAHWANGYVAIGAEKEVVNGYDDGTFRPSQGVTAEQAVKMVICALGLREEAEKLGEYPKGYIALAKDKGLVEWEITSEELKRKDAAVLIYNAVKYYEEPEVEEPEQPQISIKPSKPSGGGGWKPVKPEQEDTAPENPELSEEMPDSPVENPEEEQNKPEEENVPEYEKVPFGEGLVLKQEEADSCTASAMTMMLRRIYFFKGWDYSSITETSVKNNEKIWLPEVGLYNNITFEEHTIIKRVLDEELDRAEYLAEALQTRPEGIIIYDNDKWHALLLTEYKDGVFYVSDPATGLNTPIEETFTTAGETAEEKIAQIDSVWIRET